MLTLIERPDLIDPYWRDHIREVCKDGVGSGIILRATSLADLEWFGIDPVPEMISMVAQEVQVDKEEATLVVREFIRQVNEVLKVNL